MKEELGPIYRSILGRDFTAVTEHVKSLPDSGLTPHQIISEGLVIFKRVIYEIG